MDARTRRLDGQTGRLDEWMDGQIHSLDDRETGDRIDGYIDRIQRQNGRIDGVDWMDRQSGWTDRQTDRMDSQRELIFGMAGWVDAWIHRLDG